MESANASEQLNTLTDKLAEDLTVADFQFSLFVAAMSSYKHDTVLRPFPPMFTRDEINHPNEQRDFRSLENEVEKVPNLQSLLRNDIKSLIGSKALNLLHWCLTKGNYALKLCKPQLMDKIQQDTKQNVATPKPNLIFEIIHAKENDEKFNQLCGDRKRLYAYHGSSVENFYSILHYGLQGHKSKNALFGEGTYLSSELAISLMYSPHGRGWLNSANGASISCVAVAEMIDDPSVKCQIKQNSKLKASRSKISGSEGGEIPETYYVVRNDDMIRVKYILLYCGHSKKRERSTWSWFHQHKFALMMFLYALLLVLISLYNSKAFWSLTKRYLFNIRTS